jgi:hypothetical protein
MSARIAVRVPNRIRLAFADGILPGMEASNVRVWTGRPGLKWATRLAVVGFVAQALGSWLIWLLGDDKSYGAFSNGDFREWATFGLVLFGFLAVVAGALVRRLWETVAVAAGSLLAMMLGCAVFGRLRGH